MKKFHFGENLRIIRQAKGINQEVMAMGLGISQSTYSKLENDAKIPDPETVEKICKVLGVDPRIILSQQQLEDLLPKVQFEKQAKMILHTWVGIFFYWILMIPFLDTAYFMGQSFCEGLGTTDQTASIVRLCTGVGALAVSFFFFLRIRSGKS